MLRLFVRLSITANAFAWYLVGAQRLSGDCGRGWLFASLGQTLNKLLPNLISNYLLTLTDGPDPALRLFRDDGNHGRSLTHNPAASRSPAWLTPAPNPRRK